MWNLKIWLKEKIIHVAIFVAYDSQHAIFVLCLGLHSLFYAVITENGAKMATLWVFRGSVTLWGNENAWKRGNKIVFPCTIEIVVSHKVFEGCFLWVTFWDFTGPKMTLRGPYFLSMNKFYPSEINLKPNVNLHISFWVPHPWDKSRSKIKEDSCSFLHYFWLLQGLAAQHRFDYDFMIFVFRGTSFLGERSICCWLLWQTVVGGRQHYYESIQITLFYGEFHQVSINFG